MLYYFTVSKKYLSDIQGGIMYNNERTINIRIPEIIYEKVNSFAQAKTKSKTISEFINDLIYWYARDFFQKWYHETNRYQSESEKEFLKNNHSFFTLKVKSIIQTIIDNPKIANSFNIYDCLFEMERELTKEDSDFYIVLDSNKERYMINPKNNCKIESVSLSENNYDMLEGIFNLTNKFDKIDTVINMIMYVYTCGFYSGWRLVPNSNKASIIHDMIRVILDTRFAEDYFLRESGKIPDFPSLQSTIHSFWYEIKQECDESRKRNHFHITKENLIKLFIFIGGFIFAVIFIKILEYI